MRSISHHITPLVINGLRWTHKQTHMHTYEHPHRNNFKKPGLMLPLVVEICQNTCKSRNRMLQLLQNRRHHTVSHSLIGFPWFQVICGSIEIIGFQQSHDLNEILKIFFTSLSLELKITKITKSYRLKNDW